MQKELRLPASTEFILIRIAVAHAMKARCNATFAGHYVDEVRVTADSAHVHPLTSTDPLNTNP